MAWIRAIRLLNQLTENAISGAALETSLSGSAPNQSDFTALCSDRLLAARLASSSNAVSIVIGSTTALTLLCASRYGAAEMLSYKPSSDTFLASSTACTQLAASAHAMDIVTNAPSLMTVLAANSTAMTQCAASATAKMAFYNSDFACQILAASSTAMTALRAAAQYSVTSYTISGTTPITLSALTGTNYLVLGISFSQSTARTFAVNTERVGSLLSNTITSSGTANTLGADGSSVFSIASPFTSNPTASTTGTCYVSVLRCDV